MRNDSFIEVRDLYKNFRVAGGAVHAVDGVSFDIYRGETLALVGESGCGKSTLGRVLLQLVPATSGSVRLEGRELTELKGEALRASRRDMQLVFQDPYSSLDPRKTIRNIIAEPLRAFRFSKPEQDKILAELSERVGIPQDFFERYPHELSGGQRQRVGIARALALHPKLIVCDEPVSALDVSIQAQILNLLNDLQKEYALTYLFISHYLSVVRYLSDRVAVMFLGKICEIGNAEEIFSHPRHPYTHFLLAATPTLDPYQTTDDIEVLKGDMPSPMNPPSGCRFHTRCPFAKEICRTKTPESRDFGNGHLVACHFPMEGDQQ